VFDSRHVGAPGIAHGGAVATVFDDLFGFALYLVGEPAVTRTLTVTYSRPILLDVPYSLRGSLRGRAGRSLHMSGEIRAPHGNRAVARAESEFVIVGPEHFTNPQG
jgi:acyl-coenzyme A thioesterase PaaI-like protein